MNEWLPADLAPFDKEIILWLKNRDGADDPIGQIIGRYMVTEYFEGFIEKSASGNLNTGLQQNLVTHFKLLDDGPDEASR